MEFQLDQAREILSRTPHVLRTLLSGVSEPWGHNNEGPETWSPYDVMGHFVFGEETDWIPRARIILEDGPERAFTPFDRFAQFTRFEGWSMEQLLDRFEALRKENLATLNAWDLSVEQLAMPGTHPELGPVTMEQLLAAWVVHDFDHTRQIIEVMARQYTQEVGVWLEYMAILHPNS